MPPEYQTWLFLAFALAFAIKVPMWPFHTWLPDAHVEAPTAGSVILAGVLLKMGGYGFLRLAIPLFPVASREFAPLIGVLAVIGIVYGALVSLVQPDLKKLVAYSSVSHLGFVMLGIASFTTTAVVGSVYQMLNHGISTGALFFMVGMLYDRRHALAISEFGGLKTVMPWFSALFLLVCLSSIAMPGFNGFVGEFLILVGSWPFSPWLVVAASLGVVLAAAYILWMVQRVLYGEVTNEKNRSLPDLTAREAAILVPLVALALFMGVASPVFTRKIEPSVTALVNQVEQQMLRPAEGAASRRHARSSDAGGDAMTGPVDLRPAVPALIVAGWGLVALLAQAFTPRGRRSPGLWHLPLRPRHRARGRGDHRLRAGPGARRHSRGGALGGPVRAVPRGRSSSSWGSESCSCRPRISGRTGKTAASTTP